MRKMLTSCALCAVALSAGAQCTVQPHPQAAQQDKGSRWIATASAGTADGQGARGALLNVAATNATGMQAAEASTAQHKQDTAPGQEHRRRAGPVMLIAALAVMSAIAVRRLGDSGA